MRLRFVMLAMTMFLLTGCSSWRYFTVINKSGKSQSIRVSTGRVFGDNDTICVAFRVKNFNAKELSIPRDKFVLEAGSSMITPLGDNDALKSNALKTGIKKYLSSRNRSKLYAPSALKVPAKKAWNRVTCYDVRGNKGPYMLRLKDFSWNGKSVTMKPFKFRQVQKK
jgi:hypothetical protein